jgi:Uma2 family endonuclease
MSSAKKYIPHYTRADYELWEGDWQLIEGVAVAMSPSPLGPHERAVSRLLTAFTFSLDELGSECVPYAGLDWIVSDDTIVRPDMMIVCGDQPEGHLEKPPVMVAEVLSPSTWQLDTESKRHIYKDNGVFAYLIVDTDLKSIEIVDFRTDDSKSVRGSDTASVSISDDLSLEIDPEKIFR